MKNIFKKFLATFLSFGLTVTTATQPIAFFAALTPLAVAVLPDSNAEAGNLQCFQCPDNFNPLPDGTCQTDFIISSYCTDCRDEFNNLVTCTSCPSGSVADGTRCCAQNVPCPTNLNCLSCDAASLGYIPDNSGNGTCTDLTPAPGFPATVGCSEIPTQTFPTPNTSLCSQQGQAGCCQFCPSGTNPTADGRCTTAVGGLNAANVDTCATLNDGCIVNNTLVGPCSCTSCPAGTTFITDTNFNFCYSDTTQFQSCPPPQPVCASDEVYLVNNLGAAQGYNYFDASCMKTVAACLGGVLVTDQDSSAQGGKRCVCEAGKLGYFDANTKNVVCVADPAVSQQPGYDSVAGYCKNNPTTGEKRIALEVGISNGALGIPTFTCVDESRACLDGYLQTNSSGVSSCHCDFQSISAQTGDVEFSKTARPGGGFQCNGTYNQPIELCPNVGELALFSTFSYSPPREYTCVKQETACIGGILRAVFATDDVQDDYVCGCNTSDSFRFFDPASKSFRCLPVEAKSSELCKFTPSTPVFREILSTGGNSTTFTCLPQTASCDGGYIRTDANGVSTCDCGSQAVVEATPDGGIRCAGTLVIGGIDFSINNPLCQTCAPGFVSSLDGQTCLSIATSQIFYPCGGVSPQVRPQCDSCTRPGYFPTPPGSVGGCTKSNASLLALGYTQAQIDGFENQIGCEDDPSYYYKLLTTEEYCSFLTDLVKPDADGLCYQVDDGYQYSTYELNATTRKVTQKIYSQPVASSDLFPVRPTASARAKLKELEDQAIETVTKLYKIPDSDLELLKTNGRELLLGAHLGLIRTIFVENDTADQGKQDVISYYQNLVRNFRILRARTALAEYNIWNSNPCGYLYNVPASDVRSKCPHYDADDIKCLFGLPNTAGRALYMMSGDNIDPDPPSLEILSTCGAIVANNRLLKADPSSPTVFAQTTMGLMQWIAVGGLLTLVGLGSATALVGLSNSFFRTQEMSLEYVNNWKANYKLNHPKSAEETLENYNGRIDRKAPKIRYTSKIGKFLVKIGFGRKITPLLSEIKDVVGGTVKVFKAVAKVGKAASAFRAAGAVIGVIGNIIALVLGSVELDRQLALPRQLNDVLNGVTSNLTPIPTGPAAQDMPEDLQTDLNLAYLYSTLPITAASAAPQVSTSDYPKFLVKDDMGNIVGNPLGEDTISIKVRDPLEDGANGAPSASATVRLIGNNWLVVNSTFKDSTEERYAINFQTIDWENENLYVGRVGDNTFLTNVFDNYPTTWNTESPNLNDFADSAIGSTFQYRDKDGNKRQASIISGIDSADPTITGSIAPTPNAQGWNNTDVTVSFTCSDDQAIQSCTDPVTVSAEGQNQSVAGTATDTAGNSASASVSVNIDKTRPSGSYATNPAANSFGWFKQDVFVDLTCSDSLSGIQAGTCDDFSFTGEGQGVGGTFHTIFDNAGNSKTLDIPSVNIDRTAPIITANIAGANASGWVTGTSYQVLFSCSDALSGIAACPFNISISNFGFPLPEGTFTYSGTAKDKADNEAAVSVIAQVDHTPPAVSIALVPAANGDGWNNTDVTVDFTCTDAVSGVAACPNDAIISADSDTVNGTNISGIASDNAGNSASASAIVKLDKTLPSIQPAVSGGVPSNNWYNAGLTVSFTCSDALSDIKTCNGGSSLGEGANQSVQGQAVDKAGNIKTASAGPFNVDLTAPSIVITAPANGAVYQLGQSVLANFSVSDALSGIDNSSLVATTPNGQAINTSSTGSKSFTVTVKDLAGNPRSVTVNYSVQYNLTSVFTSPIDTGILNVAKAGKAIPVKWTLKDASGNPITNLTSATLTSQQIVCPNGSGVVSDAIEEYAVGGSGLQNLGGGKYQINWATQSSYNNTCRRLFLNLPDGNKPSVDFQFKK